MPDLFVQTLVKAVNEKPIEHQPWVYKLILLALQNSHEHCLSQVCRNTLLSDLAEVLPCMMRQESEILKDKVVDLNLYVKEKSQFMVNFVLKIP